MNPHPSIANKIPKSWKLARKYLKQFGLTRGEQNLILAVLGIKDKIK